MREATSRSGNWIAAKSMILCMSRGHSCMRPNIVVPPACRRRGLIAARELFMSILWRRRRRLAIARRGMPRGANTCAARAFARKDADAGPEQPRDVDPGLVPPGAPRGADAGGGRRAAAPDRRLDSAMRRADHVERAGRGQPAAARQAALCHQGQYFGPARPARGARASSSAARPPRTGVNTRSI